MKCALSSCKFSQYTGNSSNERSVEKLKAECPVYLYLDAFSAYYRLLCGPLNVFIVITAQFLNVILIREIDRQNSRVPCPAIVVSGKLSEGQIQKIRLSKVVRMKQDAVFMKNLAVAQEIVHLIVARRTFVTMAQAAFPTKHSC